MKDGFFTADRLLALYDRVAEAEDAIPRLRRFVLDLAVRGKLVEQDPSDEPAAELLKRIAKEKARLVKAGILRATKTREVEMTEAPFDLPPVWSWAALGEIFVYDAGDKRDPNELKPDLWLLELEDVEKETGRIAERLPVSARESLSTKSQFQVGDILYGKLRPYLNKVVVADAPGYSTTEIVAIRPYLPLCSEYCALALRRPDFVEYVTRLGQGTKMPRLRTEDAMVAPFPLPPLAEQQRIVAKVDELMALCDRLQAARAGRESVRDRLTAATLTRLTAPETDAETFPTHARFALQTLLTLTTRPDQIKTLRQTILNLAVQGKLVEQDAADEPAAELVRKIGHISDSSPVHPEAELPIGWIWAKIDQLATVGTGVTPSKSEPAYHVGGTIPWVNSAATNLPVIHAVETFVTERAVKECRLKLYPAGSLVVALYGQGKTRGQAAELQIAATVNQACAVIQFSNGFESIRPFLHLSLKKQYEEMRSLAEGGAQPNLNLGKIKSKALPLPPLAEQHRIVARVDALMVLCDQLEASLTTATTTRSRLLEALLHEALKGALGGLPEVAA